MDLKTSTGGWNQGVEYCKACGDAWRLPTKAELVYMYEHHEKIGGINGTMYWTSEEDRYDGVDNAGAWALGFKTLGACCTEGVWGMPHVDGPIINKENGIYCRCIMDINP